MCTIDYAELNLMILDAEKTKVVKIELIERHPEQIPPGGSLSSRTIQDSLP